jgi:uncharacterized membrane protein YeiH
MVLRKEIYALAALAGGVAVVLGSWLGWPGGPVAVVGAALTVAIRLLALWRHWNAPVARGISS